MKHEIFTKPIYKNKDLLTEDFLDTWCIVTVRSEQYSHGITGMSRTVSVYLDANGSGFPYAAAAYKAAKDAGIKPVSRKGTPSPYGNIGELSFTRTAITIREFISASGPSQQYSGVLYFQELPHTSKH